MKIIVVGCNWLGIELAYNLYKRGHQVSVVDTELDALKRLPPDFRGRIVEGDPLNQGVLERAGIKKADAIAIVTNDDTLNAVVGHIARSIYGMERIIVRNYEQSKLSLYEAFGLDAVSPTRWGAERIEALLQPQAMRLINTVGNGEIEVYEVQVPSSWVGQPLSALTQRLSDCLPVALVRHGEGLIPCGETILEKDDLIHISLPGSKVSDLKRILGIEEA